MLHDHIDGRIACDADGRLGLVVDGIRLDIDDLTTFLTSHEGWNFKMEIVDPLE